MKTFWLCKIFGHKFVAWKSYDDVHYEKLDFCKRCGLSLKEIREEEERSHQE